MMCPMCSHNENYITPHCALCNYTFSLGEVLKALIEERGEEALLNANVLKSLIEDLCSDREYDKTVLNALLLQGFSERMLELFHMSRFDESVVTYEQSIAKTFNTDKTHYIVNSFYYALTGENLPMMLVPASKIMSVPTLNCVVSFIQTIPVKLERTVKNTIHYIRTLLGGMAIKKRLPLICGSACLILLIVLGVIISKTIHTKNQISQIISAAELMASEEDYEGALSTIRDGQLSYPDSKSLISKESEYNIALYSQIKKNTLTDVAALMKSGDYKSAFSILRDAKNKYVDDEDYSNAYSDYYASYKSNVVSTADSIAESGDYIGAIDIISNAVDAIGEDSELTDRIKDYENTYVDNTLAQVDALINQSNFTEAETYIQNASRQLPNNKTLTDKKNYVSKIKFNSEIVKTYSGYYIKSDAYSSDIVNDIIMGFDLEIKSCDINGKIDAVFSFYCLDDSNSTFGSYKMNGSITNKQGNGGCTASLKGEEWIAHPGDYYMIDFDLSFNAAKTIITSEGNHIFGVDAKSSGLYSLPEIVKTYSGTYMPSWGVSGLDISILSCDSNTGKVKAEFYFYKHEHNPDGRTGRFSMNGNVVYKYSDGRIVIMFKGSEWLKKPDNTLMLDFFVTIDEKQGSMTSDCLQINLTA